jgi:exosortase
LLISQMIRLAGLYYMYGSLERYSIIFAVAGVVLLVWGYQIARRLVWVFIFLLLMIPLPGKVHDQVAIPLQSFASASAVFCLETAGYLVALQGNVLELSDRTSVAVAEACSGLRMLTAFTMVGAVLAFMVRRPAWQKTVIVLSSIPVAIVANTLRLVATVLLHEWVGGEVANRFFHDFAGLSMMPLAVIILVVELRLLRWLGRPTPKGAKAGLDLPTGDVRVKARE